jgi:hypothetical protein
MEKIHIVGETTTPVKMHKFNGLDEEGRIKSLPPAEQAEKHAYRNGDGRLYFPSKWFYGAAVEAMARKAGRKQKTEVNRIASRIRVEQPEICINTNEYQIDDSSAPAGRKGAGIRDIFYKPKLKSGMPFEFDITTTLSSEEVKELITYAGAEVGIGSDTKHGYGRFKVNSFKKL